jgi:hypothetical protein
MAVSCVQEGGPWLLSWTGFFWQMSSWQGWPDHPLRMFSTLNTLLLNFPPLPSTVLTAWRYCLSCAPPPHPIEKNLPKGYNLSLVCLLVQVWGPKSCVTWDILGNSDLLPVCFESGAVQPKLSSHTGILFPQFCDGCGYSLCYAGDWGGQAHCQLNYIPCSVPVSVVLCFLLKCICWTKGKESSQI